MNAVSTGWPYEQFSGRHDPNRDRKNLHNVATYFSLCSSNRVLHIAAGDNSLPGALAEDIEQYSKKEYPQSLAMPGHPISQYLPAGQHFDKVVVVNIKLGGNNPDFGEIFILAASVMIAGVTITWAALDGTHDSIVWAIVQEVEISKKGFTKVSPNAAGQFEPARADIRSLLGIAWQPGRGMVSCSNRNAVQVVWKKNG